MRCCIVKKNLLVLGKMCLLKVVVKIFIFIGLFQGTLCLRDVHMVIPESAERGSRVEMWCQYDLESDVLYQVKWYRGDREFCRYAPRDVPPLKDFPIKGIEVDKDNTDTKRLTINNVTDVANGRFTCEVSADAPSFITAQVHGSMYVVDLPESDPELTGLKYRYRVGTKLRAECVCRNSVPAANLSFFINNEPASTQHVWHRIDGAKDGPLTAYSTIQFVVQKNNFVRGKLKVRCTAIIYNIYRKSTEKSAEEDRVRTRSTPATRHESREAYSVHRLPEQSIRIRTYKGLTGGQPGITTNSLISIIISAISLLLSTVLR